MIAITTERLKLLSAKMKVVKDDCAVDVKEYDGKPFTGKTVGEIHGIIEAKIDALASTIKELIDAEIEERK